MKMTLILHHLPLLLFQESPEAPFLPGVERTHMVKEILPEMMTLLMVILVAANMDL